jgi:hypothetical protein
VIDTRPEVGDTVRVQLEQYKTVYFEEFLLEEYHHCLGFWSKEGIKKFTPLCECIEPSADSKLLYMSNYGEYHSDFVSTYTVIKKKVTTTMDDIKQVRDALCVGVLEAKRLLKLRGTVGAAIEEYSKHGGSSFKI